ncbi:hypothetical protein GCM10007385_20670 [Tateyamaria omphalii]|uniref:DUF6653 family protein n=1 Tax=Tateyamaria omphalii TaxID=299262 RepID=UPI0016739447|nr:DUF6653 family protein [Tateyamaria omphalii]GGX51891.1 hypothetical protein GCM10007385_20670 [Tateyamaria omphalii]
MTDLYRAAERLMGMQDADWRRHANPLSVWTRFTCLPMMVLAIYARQWIGWWAMPLFLLAAVWTWANPRAFPPPADFGSWASRGTLGERIFLARSHYRIAAHHMRAANILTALSALGLLPLIYGLISLNPWATGLGLVATILPKVWFVDRMVWIHSDITKTIPGDPLPDPTLPHERTQT